MGNGPKPALCHRIGAKGVLADELGILTKVPNQRTRYPQVIFVCGIEFFCDEKPLFCMERFRARHITNVLQPTRSLQSSGL
jgi:hypothetical protein